MSSTGDEVFKEIQSSISPTARALDLDSPPPGENTSSPSGRHTLQKNPSNNDVDSLKGRSKRFSKRQSKNGLAAVF